MKITKELIGRFEEDQKSYGTKVGLYNVLWCVAAEILRDLGVKNIHTTGGAWKEVVKLPKKKPVKPKSKKKTW